MKIRSLNYPRVINKNVEKMRDKIKWTFPWVKHGHQVTNGWPQYNWVCTIYDPENKLQEYFEESADYLEEETDLRELFDDTVISIIDNAGIDQEQYLGNLRPYWNSNPQIAREWQWECQHCGYRSANRDEMEVWDYMSSGAEEGLCFSCRRHDPDDVNEFCGQRCCA
jgi:hypothetical protein